MKSKVKYMEEVEKEKNKSTLIIGLLIATVLILTFNAFQLKAFEKNVATVGNIVGKSSESSSLQLTQQTAGQASQIETGSISSVVPKGVPKIYGKELGVSFDDVNAYDQVKANTVIKKLGDLDNTITLTGADKERYINIMYKKENGISCEYCCGARSVIFENGEAACGCAHSYAMRGLAKYLITKHGKEYTDDEILEEAGKWKTLFFPGQMEQKAKVLEQKGIPFNYINLASNKYRGIEKGVASGSGMVGGC